MRRFLMLLAVGMIVVALWSGGKDLPEPPRPFLCALDVDGETLLVLTTSVLDVDGSASFTVGGVGDADPARLSGEPRAAVALPERALAVFFEDGGAVLRLPSGTDDQIDWRRVAYPDPDFKPVAAVGLGGDDALVVGRTAEDSDVLAWGRLRGGVLCIEESTLPVDRSALDTTLLRMGDTAAVVWFESSAKGMRVMAASLPPRDAETPRVLLEATDIGAVGGVHRTGSPVVLVLEPEGRLTAIAIGTGESTSMHLEGLPADGHVLLSSSAGEKPRLFAYTGSRLLAWDLGEGGLPRESSPRILDAPADLRWLLLGICIVTALVIAMLMLPSLRTRSVDLEPAVPRELAGPGRRLAAWVLDLFLMMPLLVLGTGVATGIDPTGPMVLSAFGTPVDPHTQVVILLVNGAFLLYFIVAEALFGQTLGKRALEIRAVRLDGGKAGFLAIVVRNVLRMLVDVYGGAVLVFFTVRRQRVGDLLGRTLVIRTRRGRKPHDDGEKARDDDE